VSDEAMCILFIAVNGTGEEALKCGHLGDDDLPCGAPMAGLSGDDGNPICEEHAIEEGGYRLSAAELSALTVCIERVRGER
jgi:hypothetical protein